MKINEAIKESKKSIIRNKTSLFVNRLWCGKTELSLLSWDNPENCKAVLKVYGTDEMQFFYELENGFEVDIRHYDIGRLDNPNGGLSLFKIEDCRIIKQWMKDAVPFFAEGGLMPLCIYLTGKLNDG